MRCGVTAVIFSIQTAKWGTAIHANHTSPECPACLDSVKPLGGQSFLELCLSPSVRVKHKSITLSIFWESTVGKTTDAKSILTQNWTQSCYTDCCIEMCIVLHIFMLYPRQQIAKPFSSTSAVNNNKSSRGLNGGWQKNLKAFTRTSKEQIPSICSVGSGTCTTIELFTSAPICATWTRLPLVCPTMCLYIWHKVTLWSCKEKLCRCALHILWCCPTPVCSRDTWYLLIRLITTLPFWCTVCITSTNIL